MTELKLLYITDLVQCIKSSSLYRCMTNGDNRLNVALHQFENLSTNLGYANYGLILCKRHYDEFLCNEEMSTNKKEEAFYHLRNSIISFQICYDTILQIVFWSFHFAKDVHDENDIHNEIGNCKWNDKFFLRGNFRKKLNNENYEQYLEQISIETRNRYSPEAAKFADVISEYFIHKRQILNDHGNIIKHRGGFTLHRSGGISRLNKPVKLIILPNGSCNFEVPEEAQLVSNKWFEPMEINIAEEIDMLIEQNHHIVSLAKFIFETLRFNELTSKEIFAPNYSLPFTFKSNGTEQNK